MSERNDGPPDWDELTWTVDAVTETHVELVTVDSTGKEWRARLTHEDYKLAFVPDVLH